MANILADEVAGDPEEFGYNGPGSQNAGPGPMTDQELVDSLNALTRQRNRTSMSRSEILQAVVPSEYNGLTGDGLVAFWGLLSVDSVDPFGVESDVMQKVFGASDTVTALAAARIEAISRATEIGVGVVTLKTLKLQSIR